MQYAVLLCVYQACGVKKGHSEALPPCNATGLHQVVGLNHQNNALHPL
jgi:hypothetical protein